MSKRRKTQVYPRSNYGRVPRGYSRARAQRAGRRMRQFRVGYDRTGGYYGRFAGANAERKFFDTDVDDAVTAATMVVNNLTVIPEGNGESARIGRKIVIKSIHVKGHLTLPATTASNATSDNVCMMLVQDTQTNGTAMVAADLLDTDVIESFNNLANSGRFKILYKKWVAIACGGGGVATGAAYIFAEATRQIVVNKRCNIPIEYDNSATTGVITSVRSNNLYWLTQSQSGLCAIVANVRVRYTDR